VIQQLSKIAAHFFLAAFTRRFSLMKPFGVLVQPAMMRCSTASVMTEGHLSTSIMEAAEKTGSSSARLALRFFRYSCDADIDTV
jgi:hypothetical protein